LAPRGRWSAQFCKMLCIKRQENKPQREIEDQNPIVNSIVAKYEKINRVETKAPNHHHTPHTHCTHPPNNSPPQDKN